MLTLEEEFLQYKMLHIVAVLKAMMIRYYEVILMNRPELPPFLAERETPEKCADRDVKKLYNRDKKQFLEKYELAYSILAQEGDF